MHSKLYDAKRATLNVPAYTASQIKQVQKSSTVATELGSLGFVPHIKKHFAESARCASSSRVFIVDNGAYAIKLGFSNDTLPEVIHNMIGKPKAAKRKFVGAELGPVSGGYLPPVKGKGSSASSSSPPGASSKDSKNDICGDFRSLTITRPHDRGYVLNWDLQSQIWGLEQIFQRKYPSTPAAVAKKGSSKEAAAPSYITPPISEASTHCLIVTEAHLAPWSLRQKLLEYAFTTAKFGSLFVCSSAFLSMIHHRYVQNYNGDHGTIHIDLGSRPETPKLPLPLNNLCCVVVDVGYSFTHITPFFEDYKLNYAIRRLNVGGKVMTNYLKEIVSFRHFNMMDQTFLMSVIKERLCFVSQDIEEDLKKCKPRKSELRKHYVLPDQTSSILGFVLGTQPTASDLPRSAKQNGMDVDTDLMKDKTPDEAQILSLGNERFSVPEVLFHPSDLGINQAGIAESIVQSIMACPEYLREAMCANIVVVGGSAAVPGLCERILVELRQMLPTTYPIRLYISSTPGTTAWAGGKYLATHKADWLDSVAVSLAEWGESGSHIPKHRFSLF
jgi:actin-related protein 6